MRIHTNAATMRDVYAAADAAGVTFDKLEERGSRSHARAFEVTLFGSSTRHPNSGKRGAGDDYAATWDEWGVFLAHLFRVDPEAKCWAYDNAEDFRWQTGGRFDTLTRDNQHRNHRWISSGQSSTGSYWVSECKCGAVRRTLAYGHKWEEIAS